jgi:hypothetical protein
MIHHGRLASGSSRTARKRLRADRRGGKPASSGTVEKSPVCVMRRSLAGFYNEKRLLLLKMGEIDKMAERPKHELP